MFVSHVANMPRNLDILVLPYEMSGHICPALESLVRARQSGLMTTYGANNHRREICRSDRFRQIARDRYHKPHPGAYPNAR